MRDREYPGMARRIAASTLQMIVTVEMAIVNGILKCNAEDGAGRRYPAIAAGFFSATSEAATDLK